MGLMRSLQSGVAGLRNHQLYMDVIGNNVANVNTVGFKTGRVTFNEMFAQTIRGASQPVNGQGGTNPLQVGLGMTVGTIDTLFSPGSLETTGQGTDLAIQGDGFFVLGDGSSRFYSRAGVFQFNADGALTMPANGLNVQGFMANDKGEIEAGTAITDIVLPANQKIAAQATTAIDFIGNLNAGLEPVGTILDASPLYGIEEAGDNSDIKGLYVSGSVNSTITGIENGNTKVDISDGLGNTQTYTYVDADATVGNGAFHSLDDLVAEINTDFSASFSATLNGNGQIVLTDLTGAANTLTVDSNDGILSQALSGLNGDVNAAPLTSEEFSHVARADDTLVSLRDETGVSLGIVATDIITLDGQVGGTSISQGTLTVTGTTTYADFANQVKADLGITNNDGVEINAEDGALKITGDGGKAYELKNLNIVATDSTGTTSRTAFDAVFDSSPKNYNESQVAKDVEQSATATVYDSLGNDFDLTMIFTKDAQQANRWTWRVQLPDGYTVNAGDAGSIEFDSNGSLKRFDFDDGSAALQFTTSNNSSTLSVALDPGEAGAFSGLTQLSGLNANTVILNQDGYNMGVLDRITIDNEGKINGAFSNGIIQTLGQLLVANFNNPSGLLRSQGSLFENSGNSGDPQFTTAGAGFSSVVISGALEQSNVDLAEEFTKMIVAQRGFQANARTITVSDEMLSEVTNLKR